MKTRKAYVLYQNKPFEDFFPFTGVTAYSDKKDLIHGFIKGSIRKFLIVRVSGFIVAELLTKFVNVFGDEVVIQKYINPFGSAVFFPASRYVCRVKTTYISKLFYSQITFFKFLFELIISHIYSLKYRVSKILHYFFMKIKIFNLTYTFETLIIFIEKFRISK